MLIPLGDKGILTVLILLTKNTEYPSICCAFIQSFKKCIIIFSVQFFHPIGWIYSQIHFVFVATINRTVVLFALSASIFLAYEVLNIDFVPHNFIVFIPYF